MTDESEPLSPPPPPPEEAATTEESAAQLEKAAQSWGDKADEETHSAEGSLSKEMLYRATESGMRHAKEAMEEHQRDEEAAKADAEAEAEEGTEKT